MKIDNTLFNLLRDKLPAAVKGLEEELGIKIELGRGSMDRSYKVGTLKLELSSVGEDGTAENREALDFKRMAPLYGMKADDLGREFAAGGKRYKISGWRIKAPAKPILAARVDNGKEYIWALEDVKMYLEREDKKAAGK